MCGVRSTGSARRRCAVFAAGLSSESRRGVTETCCAWLRGFAAKASARRRLRAGRVARPTFRCLNRQCVAIAGRRGGFAVGCERSAANRGGRRSAAELPLPGSFEPHRPRGRWLQRGPGSPQPWSARLSDSNREALDVPKDRERHSGDRASIGCGGGRRSTETDVRPTRH